MVNSEVNKYFLIDRGLFPNFKTSTITKKKSEQSELIFVIVEVLKLGNKPLSIRWYLFTSLFTTNCVLNISYSYFNEIHPLSKKGVIHQQRFMITQGLETTFRKGCGKREVRVLSSSSYVTLNNVSVQPKSQFCRDTSFAKRCLCTSNHLKARRIDTHSLSSFFLLVICPRNNCNQILRLCYQQKTVRLYCFTHRSLLYAVTPRYPQLN